MNSIDAAERNEKIAEKISDALGDLVEKMVPVFQELGLDAEAEAPLLLDDLIDVALTSLNRAWIQKHGLIADDFIAQALRAMGP